jgi:hypothetical protein
MTITCRGTPGSGWGAAHRLTLSSGTHLHGFLEEMVYLQLPDYFFRHGIWQLLRLLYGL